MHRASEHYCIGAPTHWLHRFITLLFLYSAFLPRFCIQIWVAFCGAFFFQCGEGAGSALSSLTHHYTHHNVFLCVVEL